MKHRMKLGMKVEWGNERWNENEKNFLLLLWKKKIFFLREKKIFFLYGGGKIFSFWGYFRKTFLALILQSD